jgi:hypothetical protein
MLAQLLYQWRPFLLLVTGTFRIFFQPFGFVLIINPYFDSIKHLYNGVSVIKETFNVCASMPCKYTFNRLATKEYIFYWAEGLVVGHLLLLSVAI